MPITIERLDVTNNSKERKRFINLQFKHYQNNEYFVPQLKMELKKLFSADHPFYKSADTAFFVAQKDGKDVGRIMAINNYTYNDFHSSKEGHWGFFECVDDQEICDKLFEAVSTWHKSQGLTKLVGPFNPSTNYESGVLVQGNSEVPVLMMPYNPEYYDQILNNAGMTKAKDLLAYSLETNFEMPEVIQKIAERAENKEQITYRKVNKKDWMNELELMYEIYNDAWEANWGFVPMSKEEFFTMGKDLKMVADENLILLAMVNGEAAGFIVTLPDFNQVLHKIPSGKLLPFGLFHVLNAKRTISGIRTLTLGVKKKFRLLGLESILYFRSHKNAQKYKQYKNVEMSWVLEDNLNMNKPLIRMGAKPYRKYRIYEKGL